MSLRARQLAQMCSPDISGQRHWLDSDTLHESTPNLAGRPCSPCPSTHSKQQDTQPSGSKSPVIQSNRATTPCGLCTTDAHLQPPAQAWQNVLYRGHLHGTSHSLVDTHICSLFLLLSGHPEFGHKVRAGKTICTLKPCTKAAPAFLLQAQGKSPSPISPPSGSSSRQASSAAACTT